MTSSLVQPKLAHLAGGFLTACALCLVPVQGSADTIFGIYAGANLWQLDAGGTIGPDGNSLDFSGEFGGGDSDSTSLYVAVEHFVPLIPNVMVRTTPINWSGSSNAATGTLGGVIQFNGQVDASMDVDMTDLTLYYELLDNWVTVDVGLTARMLDGFISATGTSSGSSVSDRLDLSHTIPLLYGHARFDLPFTGLAAGVRGNGLGLDGNGLLDLEAYVHLEVGLIPTLDFGIQGGLRRLSLNLDDVGGWNSDATLEGAFIGLTAHF